jgi:hypothetical protein
LDSSCFSCMTDFWLSFCWFFIRLAKISLEDVKCKICQNQSSSKTKRMIDLYRSVVKQIYEVLGELVQHLSNTQVIALVTPP